MAPHKEEYARLKAHCLIKLNQFQKLIQESANLKIKNCDQGDYDFLDNIAHHFKTTKEGIEFRKAIDQLNSYKCKVSSADTKKGMDRNPPQLKSNVL